MFIGQIGTTYVYGLQSVMVNVWIDFMRFYFISFFVHKNLRKKSQKLKVVSYYKSSKLNGMEKIINMYNYLVV